MVDGLAVARARGTQAKASSPRTRRGGIAPGSARMASVRIGTDLNAPPSRFVHTAMLPHPRVGSLWDFACLPRFGKARWTTFILITTTIKR